ncbi:hypothetical protein [Pseudomonas putida]|uniref:hypothetical protein n=1 Tax=Pseudomonas putida TaxID=303 RepID=UPI0026596C80|nr:hypothetical protein [Pseudomonas putida]MCZ9636860.1 hypothetical protein [Pseudomonas putida]
MDTNKMRDPKFRQVDVGRVGKKPFSIVQEKRAWGMQPVLRDADGHYHGIVSLTGDAKQRRQQRRELLRQINSGVKP